MKYSYNWLQNHIEEKLPSPEALREKIIFHAFEVESMEVVGDDTVFDIKVLPDRAGDCLSHYGMAREIAGLCNLTLRSDDAPPLPEMKLLLPVEVTAASCRRYMAVRLDGVSVGPSPEWLREALERVGQRSINNIVDATNFILLDSGQPVHAYDAAKIDGGITVRAAHDHETIVTLSGEEKELAPSMTVIADYVGALAIAGVKGGKAAEIDADTTSVILEIANFDPSMVRSAARTLSLPTDAAKRFENNLSPEVVSDAAPVLVALIKESAGGEITGVYDQYPSPASERMLTCTTHDIARLLGPITMEAIVKVFDQYHYTFRVEGESITLTIPYWRGDIALAADIAEEVGRVIGYQHIAPSALPFTFPVANSSVYAAIVAAKAWLVHDGFREVLTYTFCEKGEFSVMHGPKNKSALRTNLSDGLKESYELNARNAPLLGLVHVKLFEIGTVFFEEKEALHLATVDERGNVVEMPLEQYIAEHHIVVKHATLDLGRDGGVFVPWSVYPFITRDISVWIATPTDEAALVHAVHAFAQEHCVRAPLLFDTFSKDGRTSLAFRLVFQAVDRTLTEEEVERALAPLLQHLAADPRFTLR
ncbi:MAG TPA: phenylalanine--tRNA ligase subunit beta [Candidatus Paceibacterota bacterium]|nr:phenylalanine--tRNA ligase subunit beta [Candidatus Paceibacterota bacterium]